MGQYQVTVETSAFDQVTSSFWDSGRSGSSRLPGFIFFVKNQPSPHPPYISSNASHLWWPASKPLATWRFLSFNKNKDHYNFSSSVCLSAETNRAEVLPARKNLDVRIRVVVNKVARFNSIGHLLKWLNISEDGIREKAHYLDLALWV